MSILLSFIVGVMVGVVAILCFALFTGEIMKTKILIDDGTTNGAYNIEGELSDLDEFLIIKLGDMKMYIGKADLLAAVGYVEEHG